MKSLVLITSLLLASVSQASVCDVQYSVASATYQVTKDGAPFSGTLSDCSSAFDLLYQLVNNKVCEQPSTTTAQCDVVFSQATGTYYATRDGYQISKGDGTLQNAVNVRDQFKAWNLCR